MLNGGRPLQGWDGFLYVDSLSGFFLLTVSGVTLLAALGSVSYIGAQEDCGELTGFQVKLYFTFFGLFASLMLASLETGQPRPAVRPHRGEHPGERRARRP